MKRTTKQTRRAGVTSAIGIAMLFSAIVSAHAAPAKAKRSVAAAPLTIKATEFSFDPSGPSMPSGKVRITFKNDGTVEHNLTIKSLHVSRDLKPGKSVSFVVNVKAGGSYPFYCEYHQARSMTGTLTVA